MKKVLLVLLILSLGVVVFFAFKIKARSESDSTFGQNLFEGILPTESIQIIEDFSTKTSTKKITVLLLFNPECEVCYSEIQSFIKNKELLQNVDVLLASTADAETVTEYIRKFDFSGFNSLRVGIFDPIILEKNIIPYPSVLVYGNSGVFKNGFKGNVSVETITQSWLR